MPVMSVLDPAVKQSQANTKKPSDCRTRQARPEWSHQALLIVLAALTLAITATAIYHPNKSLFADCNPYFVSMVSAVWKQVPLDNRSVLAGYKVFFLSLICLSAFACWTKGLLSKIVEKISLKAFDGVLLSALFGYFCWATFEQPAQFTTSPEPAVILACLFAAGFLSKFPGICQAAGCLMILLLCIPGFLVRPDLSNLNLLEIVQQQQHYASLIAGADKIAAGVQQSTNTPIMYGFWLPLLLGIYGKYIHSFNYASLMHFAQVGQILFLVVVFKLYAQTARRHLGIALLAFLPVIPWYHCNQIGIYYPNHSGWRYLLLAASLLVYTYLRKTAIGKKALIMGALCGTALIYNVETGIVLSAGILFSLYLQTLGLPFIHRIKSISTFIPGLLSAFAFYVTTYLLVTHSWPAFMTPAKLANNFNTPDIVTISRAIAPVALLMLGHAVYVVARCAVCDKKVSHYQSVKVAAATMLVLWEIYYFNRPYYSNLMSCWALYGLLLIDVVRSSILFFKGKSKFRNSGALAALSLLAVIIPSTIISWQWGWATYAESISRLHHAQKKHNTVRLSGCETLKIFGEYLVLKSNYLRKRNTACGGDLAYVTIYSLLVPAESGVVQRFPFIDPYFGVATKMDFQKYVSELIKDKPKFILLDAPLTDPAFYNVAWHQQTIEEIMRCIACEYEGQGMEDGWYVFSRKRPVSQKP